jgi:hypothetical protein
MIDYTIVFKAGADKIVCNLIFDKVTASYSIHSLFIKNGEVIEERRDTENVFRKWSKLLSLAEKG